MNLEKTIRQASQLLKNHNITSHELDAEVLIANILGVNKEFLLLNNGLNISKNIRKKFDFAINRRIKREPVAYITGKKEFWSESFKVNHSTLVPRPETELLIYKVVNFFKNNAPIVIPGLARDFTNDLQDLLVNQTSLELVTTNGDLIYEGEIIEYYIAPITAQSNSTAAQNRLTISINVRFFNTKKEEKDFRQSIQTLLFLFVDDGVSHSRNQKYYLKKN